MAPGLALRRPTAGRRPFSLWLFADFLLRFDYLLIRFSFRGLHKSLSTSSELSIGASWVPIQGWVERYWCSKLVPESPFTSSTLSQIFHFFNFWSSNFLLDFCVAICTLEPLQTYFHGYSSLYSVLGGARFSTYPNATPFDLFRSIFTFFPQKPT